MLHFIRPYWFLALVPLFFMLIYLYKGLRTASPWYAVGDTHLIDALLVGQKSYTQFGWVLGLGLGWLIAVLALAGPAWSRKPVPVYRPPVGWVIVLDVSALMQQNDLLPTRLERAKYKVIDFLHAVHEGQVGLVVFTDEAFVVSPLTEDANTVASLVPALRSDMMPVQGNRMSAGLLQAQQLLTQAGLDRGQVVLLTGAKPDADAFLTARKLAESGSRLSVLGVGQTRMSGAQSAQTNMDIAALKQLADAGQGRYVNFVSTDEDIVELFKDQTVQAKILKPVEDQAWVWEDEGRWVALLLLPLALMGLRRGYW